MYPQPQQQWPRQPMQPQTQNANYGGQMTNQYQQQNAYAPQQQPRMSDLGGPADGQLVSIEYVTEKYVKELKQRQPCSPHIVLKFKLQDGSLARISKFLSPDAMKFTGPDMDMLGPVGADFLSRILNGTQTPLFGKTDNRGFMAWRISNQAPPQQAPQPQAPQVQAPPMQAPQQAQYGTPQAQQPMQPQVPNSYPAGNYEDQDDYNNIPF